MKRRLDVYLYRHFVGNLVQSEHGQMTFDYAEIWLKNPLAISLSHSLPLTKKHFNQNECRGFFAGILPEQTKREQIARNLGISARNDFAMLEQIGGECAGAVTFIPAGSKLPEGEHHYRSVTSPQLVEIIKALPRRPLMAGEEGIRLSLAGAQDKIAVRVQDGQISIPLGGAPSTHILKPAIERFPGLVFNEAFCMRLAGSIGLPTAKVQTENVEGIDYLLVERYDRTIARDGAGGPQYLKREHQEDFCQALGIVPENKYQSEGGPSLKDCFDLVRESSSTPVIDLQALLDVAIFNFVIGNHDAHGKNFSLLYSGGDTESNRQTRLAPFYDLISTIYYPELSPKLAMKIGSEYAAEKVMPKDFERLAEQAGLARPMVKKRVAELATAMLSKISELANSHSHPVETGVAKLVQTNCERTMAKFKV